MTSQPLPLEGYTAMQTVAQHAEDVRPNSGWFKKNPASPPISTDPCKQCGGFVHRTNKNPVQIFCSMRCHDISRTTDDERFWARVDRRDPEQCWLWRIGKTSRGYGVVSVGNRQVRAHRMAYELAKGPIPTGLIVCHSCDNPTCCNPAHLWLGTYADNEADKVAKGRQAFGQRNAWAKLNDDIVREIRGSNDTTRDLAERYGVAPATVHSIRCGKTWKHVKVGHGTSGGSIWALAE